MTRQEAGRLGGLATVKRHGTAHISTIGRAGFRKLAQAHGSRRAALHRLAGKGRLALRRGLAPDLSEAETRALYQAVDLEF